MIRVQLFSTLGLLLADTWFVNAHQASAQSCVTMAGNLVARLLKHQLSDHPLDPGMSEIRFECLRKRREAVLQGLDGREALIAAGQPPSRNFQANCSPIRASSHFLHLAGAALPGAFIHFKADRVTLYVPRQPEGDVLWHGHQPGPSDIAQSLGIEVRYADELTVGRVMTLPTMDKQTISSSAAC